MTETGPVEAEAVAVLPVRDINNSPVPSIQDAMSDRATTNPHHLPLTTEVHVLDLVAVHLPAIQLVTALEPDAL
jgi:hypothetical protein